MDWSDAFALKRWLGQVNLRRGRAKRFPPTWRQPIMDQILKEEVDAVLFTGDFSTFSLKAEFEEAAALFAPLREKFGERLIAIPGNHDVYTRNSVKRRYLEQAFPWVHSEAATSLDLLGIPLICVHHAVPLLLRSNGHFGSEACAALEREIAELKGKPYLLAGHFPYACPPEWPETWEHRLIGEERLAELMRRQPASIYFHGHKHVRWALRPPESPDTLCLNCGSAGMKHEDPTRQAGYLILDINENAACESAHSVVYNGDETWTREALKIP